MTGNASSPDDSSVSPTFGSDYSTEIHKEDGNEKSSASIEITKESSIPVGTPFESSVTSSFKEALAEEGKV